MSRQNSRAPARQAQPRYGAEKRDPPAYQTYAADDLANEAYYLMGLAERGLYDAMKRACWVNNSVPSDPDELALAVRRPPGEVKAALTGRVLAHFVADPENPARLLNKDLRRQANRLADLREKQVRSAARTNATRDGKRHGDRDGDRDGDHDGDRDGKRHGPELNRTEQNRTELSVRESESRYTGEDSFVAEMDEYETAHGTPE